MVEPKPVPPPFWFAITQIPLRAVPPAAITVPAIVPPGCSAASIDVATDPAVTVTGSDEPDEVSLLYHCVR